MINTLSMLFPVLPVAIVAGIVWPDLFAFTMLLVLEPVSLVSSSICMVVLAVAMGFIIFPLSIVNVAIGMNQSSASICLITLPVSFIKGAINPDLDTSPILSTLVIPFSFVLCPVIECDKRSFDSVNSIWLRLRLILERLQLVSNLHN